MSEEPENTDRSRDEIISGEYVLGVLSAEDRRKVEARIAVDRRFARQVARWQANLSRFNDDYEDSIPMPGLYAGIERRLFLGHEVAQPGLWERLWGSVAVWRGLTIASVCIAAGFMLFSSLSDLVGGPGSGRLVAELSGQDNGVNLVATYDIASGRLDIIPAALGQDQPKSLEVWLIGKDSAPESIGILPANGNGTIEIPPEMRFRFAENKTIAITVEAFGGSPDGKPHGPIISQGAIRLL